MLKSSMGMLPEMFPGKTLHIKNVENANRCVYLEVENV